jgi:hypothetical protein
VLLFERQVGTAKPTLLDGNVTCGWRLRHIIECEIIREGLGRSGRRGGLAGGAPTASAAQFGRRMTFPSAAPTFRERTNDFITFPSSAVIWHYKSKRNIDAKESPLHSSLDSVCYWKSAVCGLSQNRTEAVRYANDLRRRTTVSSIPLEIDTGEGKVQAAWPP